MKILTIKEQKTIGGGVNLGRCECYKYGNEPSGTQHIIAYREMSLKVCQEACCVKKRHKPDIIYVWYQMYDRPNDYRGKESGFCDAYRDMSKGFVNDFIKYVNDIYSEWFSSK